MASPKSRPTLSVIPPTRTSSTTSSSSTHNTVNASTSTSSRSASSTSTPPSAIINVPPEWMNSASTASGSSATRGSMDMDLLPQRSAGQNDDLHGSSNSQSPTSSRPSSFVWASIPAAERTDPFNNTSSFAEDPFAGPASSSSSSSRHSSFAETPPVESVRRGSVVMIPHQFRSLTDPLLGDDQDQPIDTELSGAIPLEGFFTHDSSADSPPIPPTFNRTFSAPLPHRVGYLRHPLSPPQDPLLSHSAHPPISAVALERPRFTPRESSTGTAYSSEEIVTPLNTFSHELADSLQSAIQTLLHLSPPHLLDNAKEQYSGCTVQLPTTSLSALLTSMRSLNYLSANVEKLVRDKADEGILKKTEDFDIGELLQSVADLLGGQAAQAGVDLVLFHGDVGIKHVSVDGDGEGLGYALSHVLRQILLIANKGDTIELGLQVIPQSPSMTPRLDLPLTAADIERQRRSTSMPRPSSPGKTLPSPPAGHDSGPLLCIFEIVHNINQTVGSAAATPRAEINPFTRLAEERQTSTPKLDSLLCRRLLQHQNALLRVETQPSSPLGNGMPRRAYELSVLLPRGKPFVEPPILTVEEEAVRQPFTSVRLSREPTLPELSEFAESLRGKKVALHANLTSVFARHLTSYLAAWGLDVSHVPIEEEDPSKPFGSGGGMSRLDSGYAGSSGSTPAVEMLTAGPSAVPVPGAADRFVMIDDDVAVLRRELLRIRAESSPLTMRPRLNKRPTMGNRARSTPHIRSNAPIRQFPILIHFTSLAKYNQVRDVVSNFLGSPWVAGMGAFVHPEVMVIPKPVGPRRFLTALHTAVNQPVVDPFFSPIATSPRSPGGYFARTPVSEQREGFFESTTIAEESSETDRPGSDGSQKARSPLGEHPPATAQIVRTEAGGLHLSLPTPGDIMATPASEYFSSQSQARVVSGGSGASGVVMQSPDGRPFGMFFEPPVARDGTRRGSFTQKTPIDTVRRKPTSRRTSGALASGGGAAGDDAGQGTGGGSTASSPQTIRRASGMTSSTMHDESGPSSRRGSFRSTTDSPDHPPAPGSASRASRRKTLPAAPEPLIAVGRERASTITNNNNSSRRKNGSGANSPIVPSTSSPKGRAGVSTMEDMSVPAKYYAPKVAKKAQLPGLEDVSRISGQPGPSKKGKEDVVVPPINVLIVEDNPINQNILSMFLRKKKIKHQSAKDGLEAVEKWRTGGFHLILMDIQLPVMDGIEATKEIRKLERSNNIGIFPATPVSEHPRPASSSAAAIDAPAPASPFRSSVIIVALTASSLQSDRVNALAAGCNDFLTKPVSLKWLEKKIVEWGCMQALIDFDGWRRWKASDPKDPAETRRAFSVGPQTAARNLASRLRIDRKPGLRSPAATPASLPAPAVDIHIQSATPPPPPDDPAPAPSDGEKALPPQPTSPRRSKETTPVTTPPPPLAASADTSVAAVGLSSIHEDAENSPALKPFDLPNIRTDRKTLSGVDDGPEPKSDESSDSTVTSRGERSGSLGREQAPTTGAEKPLPAVPSSPADKA